MRRTGWWISLVSASRAPDLVTVATNSVFASDSRPRTRLPDGGRRGAAIARRSRSRYGPGPSGNRDINRQYWMRTPGTRSSGWPSHAPVIRRCRPPDRGGPAPRGGGTSNSVRRRRAAPPEGVHCARQRPGTDELAGRPDGQPGARTSGRPVGEGCSRAGPAGRRRDRESRLGKKERSPAAQVCAGRRRRSRRSPAIQQRWRASGRWCPAVSTKAAAAFSTDRSASAQVRPTPAFPGPRVHDQGGSRDRSSYSNLGRQCGEQRRDRVRVGWRGRAKRQAERRSTGRSCPMVPVPSSRARAGRRGRCDRPAAPGRTGRRTNRRAPVRTTRARTRPRPDPHKCEPPRPAFVASSRIATIRQVRRPRSGIGRRGCDRQAHRRRAEPPANASASARSARPPRPSPSRRQGGLPARPAARSQAVRAPDTASARSPAGRCSPSRAGSGPGGALASRSRPGVQPDGDLVVGERRDGPTRCRRTWRRRPS